MIGWRTGISISSILDRENRHFFITTTTPANNKASKPNPNQFTTQLHLNLPKHNVFHSPQLLHPLSLQHPQFHPLGCRDYHLQSPVAKRSQSPSTRSYSSISSSSSTSRVVLSSEIPMSCRDSVRVRYEGYAPVFGGKEGEGKVMGCRDYKLIRV